MGQAWGGGLILSARQTTPGWIITFAYLGAAVFLDLTSSWRGILRGGASGAVFGIIFFFSASFIYADILPASPALVALQIIISAFGGAVAGVLMAPNDKR